jgi:predicted acyl esterase
MRTMKNTLITMRDGVRIAADIYLPDPDARYGAVLYLGPYRKDDYILSGSMSQLPALLTSRGLVLIIADARGTNDSEGVAPVMFSEDEQRDGYELVEWIARQPWCNGNVGMTGVSYGFWTSILTAALAPPHLRTIVPIHGSVSWFYCVHEGGLPMSFGYHGNYAGLMLSLGGSPPGFRDERWETLWDHHIANCAPWGLDWFGRLADDASYESSSLAPRYECVKIPVFAIGGWWDRYPNDPLRLAEKLTGPVKVLLGPWQHIRPDAGIPGPRVDYDIVLRWFDYWLNGVRNGIMDEPLMTYYLQEYGPPKSYRPNIPGQWRHAARWPPVEATHQRWYFAAGDRLAMTLPPQIGTSRYKYDPRAGSSGGLTGGIYGGIAMPGDQNPEIARSALFHGPTLQREVEVLGMPVVRLRFATTAPRMGVVARLCDVAPDGTIALVTRGYLNIAHRDGLARPRALEPHAIYDIVIEMKATAYRFAAGHRICLMVASADFPSLFPTPDKGENLICFGADAASCLELPLVTDSTTGEAPAAPAQEVPLAVPPDRTYRVENTADGGLCAILEMRDRTSGLGCVIEHEQTTSATVHPEHPHDARVASQSTYRYRYECGSLAESIGLVQCMGSSQQIEVTASLTVRLDGVERASRQWRCVYRREFI